MGNSFCCIANEKEGQPLIIQSELMYENFENINEKELNNYNINLKNESYIHKTSSTFSPNADEDNNYFVNPLPEIVNIKRKKIIKN